MELARELAAIRYRLAQLASEPHERESIGAELERIRSELRRLAAQNREIRERLGPILGTPVPEGDS